MSAATDPCLPVLVPLAPHHARAAARLHILGQPGTFLTSLGEEVLTVLYRLLPAARAGFGFAVEDARSADLLGFVSAAESVGALFLEVGKRHAADLLLPLVAAAARNPALLRRGASTLLYPLRAGGDAGVNETAAELLSIMVAPGQRSRGLGAVLVAQLVAACAARDLPLLDVTVDAANTGAIRFYTRQGFAFHNQIQLNGREMFVLRRANALAGRPA